MKRSQRAPSAPQEDIQFLATLSKTEWMNLLNDIKDPDSTMAMTCCRGT